MWPNSAYGGADGSWGVNVPHGYGLPVSGYHGYGFPVSDGYYGLSGCGCPTYGGYGYYPNGCGYNFALIVVLFILLIIVGTVYVY